MVKAEWKALMALVSEGGGDRVKREHGQRNNSLHQVEMYSKEARDGKIYFVI